MTRRYRKLSNLDRARALRPMGNNGIFQDDNASPHRARIVDGFLQANNVRRLEWPEMSPGLSCIEHVWDVLG